MLEDRLTSDSEKAVHLATAIGQVSVRGDAQAIALLADRLTSDSNIHLATAIGQVSVKGEVQIIALLEVRLTPTG